MRVTVVSPLGHAVGAAELSDLGCAVREALAVAPPEEIVAHADLVLVEAGDDGELGGFVVRRVRTASSRIPLLLAVTIPQLPRVDPAWGHDDFVLMPYVPQELYARMRASEWRASEFTQPERIKIGPVVVDLDAHEVLLGGTHLPLANREFDLLVFLARGRGRVQRREQILAKVWGQRGGGTSRSLDVHVRRLRTKLAGAVTIETVRGVGYRLEAP
jgi:DNA-binding response OmpR family regulator